jgi:hypothetical protein
LDAEVDRLLECREGVFWVSLRSTAMGRNPAIGKVDGADDFERPRSSEMMEFNKSVSAVLGYNASRL